jgi:hypothetical protein
VDLYKGLTRREFISMAATAAVASGTTSCLRSKERVGYLHPNRAACEFAQALQLQVSQLLGSELDGPFSVVVHPAGYPYFFQVGANNYYNQGTLALVDQLVATDESGVSFLSGDRFSALYQDILSNAQYQLAPDDQSKFDEAQKQFSGLVQGVVQSYESGVGEITLQQITQSQCDPPTKIGYVQYIIASKYDNNLQNIPLALTELKREYQQFLSVGEILSRPGHADQQRRSAIGNTINPSAKNGGAQIGNTKYEIAYTDFPPVNEIQASLNDPDPGRELPVSLERENLSSVQPTLRIGNCAPFPSISAIVILSFADGTNIDLEGSGSSASKIKVTVKYPGITIIPAQPLPLSASLQSGWYSSRILAEIRDKTGTQQTGFQLAGSKYAVGQLFGPGKLLASVKTFVVSQEPTIELAFYGADPSEVRALFVKGGPRTVQLAGVFGFGATTAGLEVQNIVPSKSQSRPTVVTLSPPQKTSGTILPQDQTAHIIGGVIRNLP